MKRLFWLALALALGACQSQPQTTNVYLQVGDQFTTLQTKNLAPMALAAQAGLKLAPADKFYYNGNELPADFTLPDATSYTLQLRHAVAVTLKSPDGTTTFDSTAQTIGQALEGAGVQLTVNDFVDPPVETPLDGPVSVTYRPAQDFTISVDGQSLAIKSSAQTVGQVLAEAGVALEGLDTSQPEASAPTPKNGQIQVTRVSETLTLNQKSIPFKTTYQYSSDLPLDTQNILQTGEPGLAVTRTRVRLEDGKEVSHTTEAETVLRPAQDQIVGYGTKVVLQSIKTGGGQSLQYWRSMRIYTTWYSPCHSGVSRCSYGTVSGLPVQRGVVAVTRAWYNLLAGQQVYVPGYGVATIGDVGGGFPDDRPWMDLAYADSDPGDHLSGWVTVYFLAPAPQNVPYNLP